MKILDKQQITDIMQDNSAYDKDIAALAEDQAVLAIHPNLNQSVLALIDVTVEHGESAIRWNSGRGWVAKKFPANWNNKFVVIDIEVPVSKAEVHPLAEQFYKTMDKFTPEGWNIDYKHIWLFNNDLTEGGYLPAVTLQYLDTAMNPLIIGTVDTINQDFDVFFISYEELNAEENYKRLLEKCPNAQRVMGIRGIYNAHKEAARRSKTDMFYVVDGDAYILDNFNFDYQVTVNKRNTTHIWHSLNPINGLEYGYGGVKLFPKELFSSVEPILDVATSLGPLTVVDALSCETRFNFSEFNTWKSAFREIVKIGSGRIKNQKSTESATRIETWSSNIIEGSNFGQYAVEGALAGMKFLFENRESTEILNQINNQEWLKERFQNEYFKDNS
jgi:hypothetical protein